MENPDEIQLRKAWKKELDILELIKRRIYLHDSSFSVTFDERDFASHSEFLEAYLIVEKLNRKKVIHIDISEISGRQADDGRIVNMVNFQVFEDKFNEYLKKLLTEIRQQEQTFSESDIKFDPQDGSLIIKDKIIKFKLTEFGYYICKHIFLLNKLGEPVPDDDIATDYDVTIMKDGQVNKKMRGRSVKDACYRINKRIESSFGIKRAFNWSDGHTRFRVEVLK